METNIGEECGVAAIYLKKKPEGQKDSALLRVPSMLIQACLELQHRGQRSAGICSYNPITSEELSRRRTITPYKDVGKVAEVFKISHKPEYLKIIERCKGLAGIGHVRYSTSGSARDNYFSARDEVQPFLRDHFKIWKRFAIAFNGNIVNSDQIRSEMENELDCAFETEVDTEVIKNVIAQEIKKEMELNKTGKRTKPDFFQVFKNSMTRFDGCYNIVSLFGNGDLVVARDPQGFRPLVYGENELIYAVASESCSLEKLAINEFNEVQPGEVIIINTHGLKKRKLFEEKQAYCHFEDVYFSKSNSFIHGRTIRSVRQDLGRELAKNEPLKSQFDDSYLVIAAPKTAIPIAEAYAESLGLKKREAIEKRDAERGFINGPEDRDRIIASNYVIHCDVVGKKVIVIDDSLVRGETFKQLVKQIKKAGAKEIHGRFAEPPIIHPCFYGIDFPTSEELISSKYMQASNGNYRKFEEKIAQYLSADSIGFQTIEGLVNATGISKDQLCLACLDGNYPTACGRECAKKMKI